MKDLAVEFIDQARLMNRKTGIFLTMPGSNSVVAGFRNIEEALIYRERLGKKDDWRVKVKLGSPVA